MKRWIPYLLPILFAMILSGCAHYYQVTEPASGRVFYTTRYTRTKTGVTQFTNAGDQNYIALDHSEIKRIGREHFMKATATATTKSPK